MNVCAPPVLFPRLLPLVARRAGASPAAMSTADSDNLREAIRRTLTQRAGDAAEACTVAAAALLTWQQMASQLAPVIGKQGVEALFFRALHLTSTAYPWLADAEDGDAPIASFWQRLDAHDTTSASEASLSLLATFAELLALLIGASLTERLLASAWIPPASTPEPESTP